MNRITSIILISIAVVFTILISNIIPKKQFEPYTLELDSLWRKEATDQEYILDINNDSTSESLLHYRINKSGHSIEYRHNKSLHEIYIFDKSEVFISRFITLADINQDGAKDIIFLTARGHLTYLNILEYSFSKKLLLPLRKVKLDSISYFNNAPDVTNNFLITNESNVYFDLAAGYSIQPRNIYKFDLRDNKLTKTARSSIVNLKAELLTYHKREYLLAKKVIAAGNTVSPGESEGLKNSRNKDTLQMYEETKDRIYQFGDFASYILLYDNNLKFAFTPVEFFGWTNYTLSEIITIEDIPYIISLSNSQIENNKKAKIILSNLQGQVLKQITALYDYDNLFTNGKEIVLHSADNLDIYSDDLTLAERIDKISNACGFFDINNNKQKEFIAFNKNELIIFANDFHDRTTFSIEQEFAPLPEDGRIEVIHHQGRNCIFYNSRLFYYLFSYSKNHYAWLKYPFYALMMLFWFGLLFFVVKFNTKRLEKDKQHLESIINERTLELKYKNEQLALQKDEIGIKAEELRVKNRHLEELDKFKRILISTLVHDLKNPLGQIMMKTTDKKLKYTAGKMLRLVMNLLDVEKYEQTTFSIDKQPVSLRSILDEVISCQEIILKEKNLSVLISTDDIDLYADKEILKRVFENLITNAVRFSIQNHNIEITALASTDEIISISIKNYGSHIPDEALETIFDKYIQAEKIDSSGYKSTGLGLTFCRMAIQAHGHTIKARNTDNGVLFEFTLDGKAISTWEKYIVSADESVKLSTNEEALLRPWLDQLSRLEICQISEITSIVSHIPDYTDSIRTLKQKIGDAAFASNTELYSAIVNGRTQKIV
ncbi:MAG TPA: hypothetical protein DEO70_00735 [Bacteroidales bacterium]|nr:MAG: hypothetical protein A2X11_04760 [Bacteroidetes bacterium GWE2_42_24]OFY30768.1 MAG: hypothetical protein A2X09_16855 [Bacteroidetes bacterium GWF2_43_11]HBZ65334.1 hypothetical protein [Bacteroidales bacterium]